MKNLDEFVVIVFTVEYAVRMILVNFVNSRLVGSVPSEWDEQEILDARKEKRAPHKDPPLPSWYSHLFNYCTRFYNIIDVLAILPFYILLGSPGSYFVFLKVMHLLRVLRLLKLTKNSQYTVLLAKTMKDSVPVLTTFALFVSLGIVVFACLINIAEDGKFIVSTENPNGAYMRPTIPTGSLGLSPFHSIPDALYFVVITTSTVGYGDMFPTSELGRFFCCVMAYAGVFTWTLPLAIIGYNFVKGHEKLIESERERVHLRTAYEHREIHFFPDEICSADILKEAVVLLTETCKDAEYISQCARSLENDSLKMCNTASLLRHALSPPGVWDWESEKSLNN